MNCNSLALTSLPDGLTNIDLGAFLNCTSLALTSLPDGLTSIGDRAFCGCTTLALTSLPRGLTSISDRAFLDCTSLALTSQTLPDRLTSIGSEAFYGCHRIAATVNCVGQLTITTAVTTIGVGAFDCRSHPPNFGATLVDVAKKKSERNRARRECKKGNRRAHAQEKQDVRKRARAQEKQTVRNNMCISCFSSCCILLLVPRESAGVAFDLLALALFSCACFILL